MKQETFKDKLERYANEKNTSLVAVHEELMKKGVSVSYASLYAYLTGKSIPPREKAEEILTALEIPLEKNAMSDLLCRSKQEHSKKKDEEKILHLNLKITPAKISESFERNPVLAKQTIEKRAEEMFGDSGKVKVKTPKKKRKLSAYVASLIKKDLEENGVIER